MSTMERLFRLMRDKQASDIFLSAHAPILIKINGICIPVNSQLLGADGPRNMLAELVPPKRMEELDTTGELNMGLAMPGVGRFRVSAMRQNGTIATVVRFVNDHISTLAELNLPPILGKLGMERRGLTLIVGATGSGKSTALASMIEGRNATTTGHILTLEDPIEFLFQNKKSIINQREIGTDANTLEIALKNALRQAPDVIMISEIRDRETMAAALAYAQSGHLVLATMHASNSYQALNRILSFYPAEIRPSMLGDLASALRSIVSQRLLRAINGARIPAVEVLLNTKLIGELIEQGNFSEVREAMISSTAEGSQTFEASIAGLINDGLVERDEGMAHADSPNNLLWRLGNDFSGAKNIKEVEPEEDPDDTPSFTEITLDI